MSLRHPIISVTGSSGAGTTTVKHTFDQIFRREGIRAVSIEGDAFHRFDRQAMKDELARRLAEHGLRLVSGGTDSHLMLVDLRPKGVTGKATEHELEKALMTCNKNGVPFDTAPFTVTSGVRLGTPAGTTRGFGEDEFKQIGHWIADVVSSMNGGDEADPAVVAGVAAQVRELTHRFPIYGQEAQ